MAAILPFSKTPTLPRWEHVNSDLEILIHEPTIPKIKTIKQLKSINAGGADKIIYHQKYLNPSSLPSSLDQ